MTKKKKDRNWETVRHSGGAVFRSVYGGKKKSEKVEREKGWGTNRNQGGADRQ